MPTISVRMETIYACNVSYDRDPICLQSSLMGTTYACNLGKDGDHIYLQSWSRKGPNMHAISVTIGTIYAIVSDGNHICLQRLKFFQYLQSDRVGSKRHLKFWSLQTYMVPIRYDCRHIWSLS